MNAQQKPIIEIVKHPPERGAKRIMVDGALWGTIEMRSRGMHGPEYLFFQYPRRPIELKSTTGSKNQVTVSARVSRRRRAYDPASKNAPTIEELIADKARELVDVGLLIHPDKVLERERNARTRFERRLMQEQAEREAEAMERAITITNFFPPIATGDLSQLESLRSLIQRALLEWRDKP